VARVSSNEKTDGTSVNKTLEFRHKQKDWRAGPPKTQHSYRVKGVQKVYTETPERQKTLINKGFLRR